MVEDTIFDYLKSLYKKLHDNEPELEAVEFDPSVGIIIQDWVDDGRGLSDNQIEEIENLIDDVTKSIYYTSEKDPLVKKYFDVITKEYLCHKEGDQDDKDVSFQIISIMIDKLEAISNFK